MLAQTIHTDLISAMKSGDTACRDVLRFLESDLKKRAIDSRKELTDEDIQKVIASHIKSRRDSVAQFRLGNREDLVGAELDAIVLLEKYLPRQMSQEELETFVAETLGSFGTVDIGKAMGVLMPKISGRADGNRVREAVINFLACIRK